MFPENTDSVTALLPYVRHRLVVADSAWRSGDFARLPEGFRACDEAMLRLKEATAPVGEGVEAALPADLARLVAEVWLQRGHLCEAVAARDGKPEALAEALRGYEQAIGLFGKLRGMATEEAGAWMNRGNALQRSGTPEALAEAVRCYDRTIGLLGDLPAEAPVEAHVMLGAAWMNRGGAQERIGGEAGRAEAWRSFEQAVAQLESWADAHWGARRNLAAAWTNLGLARLAADEAGEAMAAQEKALAVIGPLFPEHAAALEAERATILLNLGQARHAANDHEGALAVLREALAGAALREAVEPAAAEMALRARHMACVTLAALLPAATGARRAALVEEAGDLVEDALALIRGRGGRGERFRATGTRLFEFGAWFYRTQQPRFFAEFLLDHLEDDEARARIAWTEVSWARQEIVQEGFAALGADEAERTSGLLAGLREVEERLRALAARKEKAG